MIVNIDGKVEAIRARLGLTKTELAGKAGVSHTSIVRVEQGKSISPKTSKAICDSLGVSFDELFTIVSRQTKGAEL